MNHDFIATAKSVYEMAVKSLERQNVLDGYELMGTAISAAFMAGSETYISFRIVPRAALPREIASVDHVIAHLSKKQITIFAAAEIITQPLFTFERFPVAGHILSDIAQRLPESGLFRCVFDLGDGNDAGDYRRLAFSSSRPDTILVPDPYFYYNDNYDQYRAFVAQWAKPWHERQNIIFWRGGSGGPRLKEPNPQDPLDWECQQRLRLCAAVRKSAHAAMLDVALCHVRTIQEPYLREAIEREGFLKPEVPKDEFLKYRYQVDVDGWTNAWSLLDKMISGAAILKVQSAFGFRQWFYDKLVAWENYIPVAADVSDLDEVVGWIMAHPDDCARIAGNALALADSVQLQPSMAEAETAALAVLEEI